MSFQRSRASYQLEPKIEVAQAKIRTTCDLAKANNERTREVAETKTT